MGAIKKKILFIDDEKDILEAVKIILESENFLVKTATDISSINDILQFDPDLLLLDVVLDGKSGKDICIALRGSKKGKDIPIIMLSAHPMTQLKTLFSESGATEFLQKPFDMHVLITTVKKYLR